jgi:hypothetical protein
MHYSAIAFRGIIGPPPTARPRRTSDRRAPPPRRFPRSCQEGWQQLCIRAAPAVPVSVSTTVCRDAAALTSEPSTRSITARRLRVARCVEQGDQAWPQSGTSFGWREVRGTTRHGGRSAGVRPMHSAGRWCPPCDPCVRGCSRGAFMLIAWARRSRARIPSLDSSRAPFALRTSQSVTA